MEGPTAIGARTFLSTFLSASPVRSALKRTRMSTRMSAPQKNQMCPGQLKPGFQNPETGPQGNSFETLVFTQSFPLTSPKSQRDSIIQPRVARNELPWVSRLEDPINPERVESIP